MDFDMYRLLDRQDGGAGDSGFGSQVTEVKVTAGGGMPTPPGSGSDSDADSDQGRGGLGNVATSTRPFPTASATSLVTFKDKSVSSGLDDRIFDAKGGSAPPYNMAWAVEDPDLVVQKASWRVNNSTTTGDWVDVANYVFSNSSASNVLLTNPDAKLGISLTIADFHENESLTIKRAKEMVMALEWTLGDANGTTTSRAFTVIDSQAEDVEDERSQAQTNLEGSKYAQRQDTKFEAPPSDDSNGSNESGTTSKPTQLTIPPKESHGSTSEHVDGKSGGSGGGGLSTGAIAGIAVGVAIVALIALGAAIFFCLRRKRRRSTQGDQYGQQAKMTSCMAANKDVAGNTADSPQSPYRDDQFLPQQPIQQQQHQEYHQPQQQHQVPSRAPVATSAGTADRNSYNWADGDHARSPTPGSGAMTPQHGVSRHLVEDGMTMDEIRRLEQEERELDDEIQRAGRR